MLKKRDEPLTELDPSQLDMVAGGAAGVVFLNTGKVGGSIKNGNLNGTESLNFHYQPGTAPGGS